MEGAIDEHLDQAIAHFDLFITLWRAKRAVAATDY
jgi:hypothetical protein